MRDAFVGYPGEPKELTENLDVGIEIFRKWRTATAIRPWAELGGPSTPIIYDVLKTIRECEVSFFDVTIPNQNVLYEIGYSAGLGKAIFLLLNDAFKDAMRIQIELGIFDTHRLKRYRNGPDLANILRDAREPYHQTPPGIQVNVRQPLLFSAPLRKDTVSDDLFCVR